jgi:hypothetical protein
MFLKSELLESNGSSVTLFQLSALQRIEHLEYLKQMEALKGRYSGGRYTHREEWGLSGGDVSLAWSPTERLAGRKCSGRSGKDSG